MSAPAPAATVADFQIEITKTFRAGGLTEPGLEARLLLQAFLGGDGVDLIRRAREELSSEDQVRLRDWVARRGRGEPLAYLCGRKGFYKSEFLVEPETLVPRPETELVVEVALRETRRASKCIADLGAGTGCLGLSVLLESPGARLWSVDISPRAQELTMKNARQLGVESRVEIVGSKVESWMTAPRFDLIVANPPYIPEGDVRVEAGVHRYEPHLALYSGADGLDALRAWSAWAFAQLELGGVFVTEFGAGQSDELRAIISDIGFAQIKIENDLAGIERVLSCRKME